MADLTCYETLPLLGLTRGQRSRLRRDYADLVAPLLCEHPLPKHLVVLKETYEQRGLEGVCALFEGALLVHVFTSPRFEEGEENAERMLEELPCVTSTCRTTYFDQLEQRGDYQRNAVALTLRVEDALGIIELLLLCLVPCASDRVLHEVAPLLRSREFRLVWGSARDCKHSISFDLCAPALDERHRFPLTRELHWMQPLSADESASICRACS